MREFVLVSCHPEFISPRLTRFQDLGSDEIPKWFNKPLGRELGAERLTISSSLSLRAEGLSGAEGQVRNDTENNMNDLTTKKCVPCEKGSLPLTDQEENEMLKRVQHDTGNGSDWVLIRDGTHKIRWQFKFKNFKEAMSFVNKVAKIAEEEGHHPDIYIFYNKVQLDLFTHAVGGLSENDFIMAAKINSLKTSVST